MPLSNVQFLELVFNMKLRCVYDLQKANWVTSQPLGIFLIICIVSTPPDYVFAESPVRTELLNRLTL